MIDLLARPAAVQFENGDVDGRMARADPDGQSAQFEKIKAMTRCVDEGNSVIPSAERDDTIF